MLRMEHVFHVERKIYGVTDGAVDWALSLTNPITNRSVFIRFPPYTDFTDPTLRVQILFRMTSRK